jgi:hypothetical protein
VEWVIRAPGPLSGVGSGFRVLMTAEDRVGQVAADTRLYDGVLRVNHYVPIVCSEPTLVLSDEKAAIFLL